jgi:hypothetical protein
MYKFAIDANMGSYPEKVESESTEGWDFCTIPGGFAHIIAKAIKASPMGDSDYAYVLFKLDVTDESDKVTGTVWIVANYDIDAISREWYESHEAHKFDNEEEAVFYYVDRAFGINC